MGHFHLNVTSTHPHQFNEFFNALFPLSGSFHTNLDQYDLRRYPDSQINIVKIDGKDALVYRELQSKTRQGGYLTGVKIQQGCLIVFVQG